MTGAKELSKLLKKLPVKVEKNFMRQAVRAGARVVVKDARKRVPKNTGNLAKSLGVVSRRAKNITMSVKARSGKKQKNDGFYGRFIEFGTRKMAARPFLRPALESNVSNIIKAMADKLNQAIDKFVKKYGN
jgi:HK97 gp10 family phage protein